MKSLKQIINRYIRSAAIVMALVILVVIAFAEILIEQGRVEDTAAGTFVRLEQIIEENENELKQVKEKYDKTCLHDAEAIAFLLQKDPEATNDTLKLKKYANLLELDEIHIFDETGTIVSGTNPEYYGYSFSSGEQMAFFAPMLTDKSLQLEQAQDSSEAVLHDGQHVPLRFSMGCCFIDEVAAPYDEMLEKADIAMYQNKRQRKEKHGKQPRRKE